MLSYPLFTHPLLKAYAYLEDGRLRVRGEGPLAYLPHVRSSLEMISDQVPAYVGDKLYISTWIPPVPSPAFRRLAKSQVKASLGIRTPDQVTISITEECPNRCLHCALPDSGRQQKLDPERVKGIIAQVLEMGTTLVIFDGGEPALYKELPDLVRSVDERAIATLFTSGAGFSAKFAEQLKEAGLHAVNVSLDSPHPEEHDRMRGRIGVFRDAIMAVENALQAELLVDLYVVIMHQNISQIREFHDLCRRVGAHELTFFEVVPTGRWEEKKDVILTPEDHHQLQRFVEEIPFPRIFSVPFAYRRFGCFGGKNWMHITPSGDAYPCACFPHSYGNVLKEPIKDIWRRMGRFPYKGEKSCPMRKN
jgi:MoaA/NifB/PqqE/SkfB family radical SAM enzyme